MEALLGKIEMLIEMLTKKGSRDVSLELLGSKMEQSQPLRNDDAKEFVIEFAFRVLRDIIIPSLEEHPKMYPVVTE